MSPANSTQPSNRITSTAPTGSPHPYHLDHADSAPEILARLEWLDDLIFAAIDGDAVALDHAATAWRKSLDDLGPDALEESRHQYLRHAQTVWSALRDEPNHPPHKVFAAIEVISLLTGKVAGYGTIGP